MILESERIVVDSVEQVQEAIRTPSVSLLPRGGGTKPALSTPPAGALSLDLRGVRGMVEYEPGEFTFTARAGTPLAEIAAALAEHGQYLPFDPPLVEQGATLGGAIAAGLSGARRYRYGGLRDFLIGVRFVDGRGRLVRGGGKVVKNAAGFDLPKLLIGSAGRLAVLVEASFKVFPNPPAFATLRLGCASWSAARSILGRLASAPLDIEALDVTSDEGGAAVWVRIGGMSAVLPERLARMQTLAGGGDTVENESVFWQQAASFAWAPDGHALAKVVTNPQTLEDAARVLSRSGALLRASAGGHLMWVAWPGALTELNRALAGAGLAGVSLRSGSGPLPASPLLGVRPDATMLARITAVLDPDHRFLTL